jgi:SAM-dependent methyltransferase
MTADIATDRAMSFDRVATSYKKAHVGYPEALISTILALSEMPKGGRILEVGSGTGAATIPFATRGYRMVCVEPGANMVKVARETCADYPNVTIHGTTFESWPLEREAFDLVFSARALHWVDPRIRFVKTADALRPGGSLAIFKNLHRPSDSPVELALRRIIERYVPYPREYRMGELERQFATSPHFDAPTEHILAWSCVRDAHIHVVSESISLDYYDLSAPQRSELFSEMEKTINEYGGTIEVQYETHLLIGRRRKGGSFWRCLTAPVRRSAAIPYSA